MAWFRWIWKINYQNRWVSFGLLIAVHICRQDYADSENVRSCLYSRNTRTSYREIIRSDEATRFEFRLFQSLWNLTGNSTAALLRCPSNFRVMQWWYIQSHTSRDLARYRGKMSYCLVNRGTGLCWVRTGMGRGLLKLRLLISPLAKYSISQKCPLGSLNHIHIWQVSPQLGCGDTCQI